MSTTMKTNRDAVLAVLDDTPRTTDEIAVAASVPKMQAQFALTVLAQEGRVNSQFKKGILTWIAR